MKLDYDYLKKILIRMEECPRHRISSGELLKDPEIAKDDLDKFAGHIHILFDFGCIDCPNEELGFQYPLSGRIVCVSAPYRLTAKGYEFLDMLKNETIFNKIKNLAISNALDIGKQMLIAWGIKQVAG